MNGFSLIETMRWQPEGGFARLSLHLARLTSSAGALGFAGAEAAHAALIDHAKGDLPLRVRLELFQDGKIGITSAPYMAVAKDAVWKLKIADTRIDSANRLLAHKTSLRDCYDSARGEYSRDEADEVLLLNEKDAVCEGTITTLFVDVDGVLLTPPISNGLLAGILRTELICAGKAVVKPLFRKDLEGRALYVGNSLRGLIAARIT